MSYTPTTKRIQQFRQWLKENGPATRHEISKGISLNPRCLGRLIYFLQDEVSAVEFVKKGKSKWHPVFSIGGEHIGGWCDCGRKTFYPPESYLNDHGKYYRQGKRYQCNECKEPRASKSREVDEDVDDSVDFPPTQHPPGSKEKLLVLQSRYNDGVPLWHFKDAGYERYESGCYPNPHPSSRVEPKFQVPLGEENEG